MAEDPPSPKAPVAPAAPIDHLRAVARLAVDATTGITDVVEDLHEAFSIVPTWLGPGFIYKTIRGATRLVGASLDRVLEMFPELSAIGASRPEREHLRAALNGVFGDHLAASNNPLAIQPRLRRDGRPLELTREALATAFPNATGDVLLLIHGSSMSDIGWRQGGHDHGALLESELGLTALHFNYNSGLHVSINGRSLCDLLTVLVSAWPVPLTSLTFVTHSMGGLVARSACHLDPQSQWLGLVRAMVFMGTPHHGAPLEQGGNWVDALLGLTPWTRPLARLAKIRSAGITDLRYGSILESDWHRKDRFQFTRDPRPPTPLPEHVAAFAVAAAIRLDGGDDRITDGIVPVYSALGRHRRRPEMTLVIPPERQHIAYGTTHLGLLSSRDIYAVVRTWLN